jgi:hypothetical protein
MMVIDFGAADFWKCIALGREPITTGCSEVTFEFITGGADGTSKAGRLGDFVQHFFHRAKLSKAKRNAMPIMAAGDENNQWADWKGFVIAQAFFNNSLASKLPGMVVLS